MDIYTEILITDPVLRIAIYRSFEGRCFYTGRKVEFSKIRIDHIYPRAKGGKDCIANYVLTSYKINRRKSDKVDESLVERIRYINIVAFAPMTLKIYLEELCKVNFQINGETLLKPYIKENHPDLMCHFPELNSLAKRRLPYRREVPQGKILNVYIFKVPDVKRFIQGWFKVILMKKGDISPSLKPEAQSL